MTKEEEDERLNEVLSTVTREHQYSEDDRAVVRWTTCECGYKIPSTIISPPCEQLDMMRATVNLDKKEETYLRKLIQDGRIL